MKNLGDLIIVCELNIAFCLLVLLGFKFAHIVHFAELNNLKINIKFMQRRLKNVVA